MSEEEKEAIEDIDLFIHCLNYGEMKMTIASERQKEIAQELQLLLNLLNKQQKEIEELKKPKYLVYFENNKITKMELINDYISKDKIRERIKNIEDIYKKEMKPYQTEFGLNVSLLSKKEKKELINKRNGLLTQKITLEELLEGN